MAVLGGHREADPVAVLRGVALYEKREGWVIRIGRHERDVDAQLFVRKEQFGVLEFDAEAASEPVAVDIKT